MVRVKIDNRVRVLTENAINTGHRALFVIVGERSRDQVVTLYHILAKSHVKTRPSVLWCYKKELGFSTHRKKRMRQIEKMQKSGIEVNEDNPFELFLASANVRWCYYHETHKILGQTFGMAVLQDFEAMQPNILARTVETVEGGGLVVILLNTLNSLKQLYTMSMDVHARYRTESHQDVVSRFNERFILSLMDCKSSCIIDDKLNVLPVCSHILDLKPVAKVDFSQSSPEFIKILESVNNKEPLSSLVALCKTVDQANAVIKFTDALSKKTARSTVSLTAARGRGKSAALGLSIASAIAHNFSNIYVTSPSPENLTTLFEFAVKGLTAVHLTEHHDYDVIRSTDPDHNKAVIKINVYKDHRQTIQYVDPVEASQNKLLTQTAELFVIDEAAAIPMPIVRSFLSSHLVFLSSTINGYEGTGRSLSLKLINQLRQNTATPQSNRNSDTVIGSRLLHELQLKEPIRYKENDPVEKWLHDLLCLDATIAELPWQAGCPSPDECQLYYINRDTLFSYHKTSESFLHHLMALYVASHYKNTPNDLQMISDAPAHHLFCLLPPNKRIANQLPEVLCFIQVCLEGDISRESIINSLARGRRAAGDLIPWTVSQQLDVENFASLSGARVVRIASNPNYQKMGYGSRTLKLLEDYYSGKFDVTLEEQTHKMEISRDTNKDESEGDVEVLEPRKDLPPLLSKLEERRAERLDYLGVAYGLTQELFKFWKRNSYVPVYLRQTPSDLTGEYSSIMLKMLKRELGDQSCALLSVSDTQQADWLASFYSSFRERFFLLLSGPFRNFSPQLSLSMVRHKNVSQEHIELSQEQLREHLSARDVGMLDKYARSLTDHHQITHLVQKVARLYFMQRLPSSVDLSAVQAAILLCMGGQHKTVDQTSNELELDSTQLLGLFNRAIRKIATYIKSLEEKFIEQSMGDIRPSEKDLPNFEPLRQSLNDELNQAARSIERKQKKENKKASSQSSKYFDQFSIRGNEKDWQSVLKSNKVPSVISVPSVVQPTEDKGDEAESEFIDPSPIRPKAKAKKFKNLKNVKNKFKKPKFSHG
ncbi:RNA cytidine acetyltransferase, partial [Fragariocoptes setiger]